jgi:hypothetical protein
MHRQNVSRHIGLIFRLWNIFYQELSKAGIDPEMHRKIFNNTLDPYKSHDESMRNILEEVRSITNKSVKEG